MPTKTTAKCSACKKGNIVRDTEQVFDGSMGSLIIGPGSRNQMRTKQVLYCGKCYVVYYRLPEGAKDIPSRKKPEFDGDDLPMAGRIGKL